MLPTQDVVRPARADEADLALELLLSTFSAAERRALAAELRGELRRDQGDAAGLFVQTHDGAVTGAALAQRHPGRTASIWRPRFASESTDAMGSALVATCADWLAGANVTLAQSLLEIEDAQAARWFEAAGFSRIARLAYLVCDLNEPTPADTQLEFTPLEAAQRKLFADVIEESYRETLDCPALNGIRTMDDVLDGYRAIGAHRPEHWLFVKADQEPVGCLILADHPASRQCELIYMGLIPAARGRGLGVPLLNEALRRAWLMERERLVLAVDLENAPALTLYLRAGFRAWDERDVYARVYGRTNL